jgi:hypothetical protein
MWRGFTVLFFMFAVAALTFAATLAQAAPSGGVP